jgi:hypothetical protein
MVAPGRIVDLIGQTIRVDGTVLNLKRLRPGSVPAQAATGRLSVGVCPLATVIVAETNHIIKVRGGDLEDSGVFERLDRVNLRAHFATRHRR